MPALTASLIARVQDGDRRALARLLSVLEDGTLEDDVPLASGRGDAMVIGITGPPGAGKSTLTAAIVVDLRSRGRRIGILAVDPSSPVTGGALLGDRVRMAAHAGDPDVFIRSIASRGRLGGLADVVPDAVTALEAWGADVILIETVGTGQSDIAVTSAADHTVLVLTPTTGDEIQAAKAGVLEVADVIVVNKADLDGAHQLVRALRAMLRLHDGTVPPIVTTCATAGDGIEDLWAALEDLPARDHDGRRRRARLHQLADAVAEAVRGSLADAQLDTCGLIEDHLAGRATAGEVVRWVLRRLTSDASERDDCGA